MSRSAYIGIMDESRLVRYAKQGEPEAIASFLGNHLARFNVWVTATPDRYCLNLSLDSLEPPPPEVILPPVQQLIRRLNPDNVELVKISARHYGDLQAVWQQTFLLSEITLNQTFLERTTELDSPASSAIAVKRKAGKTAQLTSATQLAIAINKNLQNLDVAAKVVHHSNIIRVELRGRQVPQREACLTIIYDLLQRLDLPAVEIVQVIGLTARQLEPSWAEDIMLDDILLSRQKTFYKKFVSFKEEEEFWLPLGFGLAVGLILFVVPLFDFAFSVAGTLIFDIGQALGYSLMGYLPTAINNPFEGGGVMAASGRSPLLFGSFYGLWGLLLFLGRRRFLLIFMVIMIALWHGLIYQSTILTNLFVGVSGQLMLWALASVFFYCALGGYSCRNQGERSLYMVFGTFFMFHHLERYWQMWHDSTNTLEWGALLGIALTLTLPYLTYWIFRANRDRQKGKQKRSVRTLQSA
ncbi:hypothetical protein [[Limnothrix rosea] IAM M-220]|uniref:hypothetical protein n=1 Tax=[Limnothrix rosea] IAM M-220 TaxID=454133 RepID=UPI0011158854|nr:hypothetical protein [[Limnothrix rosea] IAM M-220]